jgi:hypothetical protein
MMFVPMSTVSPSLAELLATFVSHFKRAIRQEMDAMRERKGSFEIALAGGVIGESGEAEGGAHYIYSVLAPNEKWLPASNAHCGRPPPSISSEWRAWTAPT